MGSLRDREVTCSASDHQGPNFESCLWRAMSALSCHHLQVILPQFSLYVHNGGLKPHSFPSPGEHKALQTFDASCLSSSISVSLYTHLHLSEVTKCPAQCSLDIGYVLVVLSFYLSKEVSSSLLCVNL